MTKKHDWMRMKEKSRGVARSLLLALAATLGLLACKQSSFTGLRQVTPIAEPEPSAAPSPPPPALLQLNVVTLNPEAWWKSCLFVSVNGDDERAVSLGCNKDANVKGRTVSVPVNAKSCNSLRFFIDIHQNTKNCSGVKDCPTSATPTCRRVNIRPLDKEHFVIVDGLQIGALDKRVRVTDPEVAQSNRDIFTKAQTDAAHTKYIRMFFEDMSDDNLVKYKVDASSADAKVRLAAETKWGIDFNDYVFDVIAKDIAVTVEGTNIACALPQTEPIKPYVEKSPAGCKSNALIAGPATAPEAPPAPAAPPGAKGSTQPVTK